MRSCVIASRRSCSGRRCSRCSSARPRSPRAPATRRLSYNIGFIYPRTGILGAYGAEELEGFKYGLQYATNGTGKVNGKTLNITYQDDQGVAATGVTEAKNLIGQGVKILMGTGSSGVAVQIAPLAAQNQVLYLSGPAAADAITGINKYTFRAGRQTIQDVLDAKSFLGKTTGKKVVVFDQDSVFGHGNYAAVKAFFTGHNVSEVSVPLTATDFTPFAQQAKNANPDLLFVAWAGTTGAAMFKTLDQQGVYNGTQVVTGLAERATWAAFGGPGDEDPLPVALRLHRSEEQGERLARAADAQARPGARPLHARRVRRGADARARPAEGRLRRRQDDQRSRGLEVPRTEGLSGDQAAGSRDAAADVQGRAREEERPPRRQRARHCVAVRHGTADRCDEGLRDRHQQRVSASPILATRNLGLDIGGATIVADVGLEVREGELLAVIGPNGAGKTTLFNLVSGLHRPTSGSVELDGVDITAEPPFRRARAGLGRTFQVSNVFPLLSVHENVRLAAEAAIGGTMRIWRRATAVGEAVERAAWAIGRVGLAGRDAWPAGLLSHGDKRKLELAMLLAARPRVLLLDEPMAGVSMEDVPELVELIRSVHADEGKTVLMVEHHMEVVTGLAQRIAVMHGGRLLAIDTPDAIMRDEVVQHAYLGEGL